MVNKSETMAFKWREILNALSEVKIDGIYNELKIHKMIKEKLKSSGIQYKYEYKVAPHKRFDFWIDGIILEVKNKKPAKINLLNQIKKYLSVAEVKGIIIVLNDTTPKLPKELCGKPIFCLSLHTNWGIAL